MPTDNDALEAHFVLAEQDNYLIEVPHAGLVSELGWDMPIDLTIDKWKEYGKGLGRSERSLGWWIGDWWVHGLSAYGGNAKKIVESPDWTGPTYRTCQKYAVCCKRFPLGRRRGVLSFWQHYELRTLPEEQQDKLLDEAVEHAQQHGTPPSVKQLREQVVAATREESTADIARRQEIHRAHGEYPLGFCDPRWDKIDVFKETNRQPPLAQDAAVLFILASTDVYAANVLLGGWGFDNVGSIVFQQRIRPTVWTQEEHRLLLIGARGEVKPEYAPRSTQETSSISAIINLITEMFPHLTRRVQCLGQPISGFDDWHPV